MFKKFKILIDAGHEGYQNRSPVLGSYYESQQMWKLHLMYVKEFQKYKNIEIHTTRNGLYESVSLYERGMQARGMDLFISLHSNAAAESADYPVVITPLSGVADAVGNKIARAIEKVLNTNQSGRVWHKKNNSGTNWYAINRHGCAAGCEMNMIIEHGFHTNTATVNKLIRDDYLQKLAEECVKVFANHFGLELNDGSNSQRDSSQTNSSLYNEKICGKNKISASGIISFIQSKNIQGMKLNCKLDELVNHFISEGKKYNVRGDIAICQSLHETGWFKYGGIVLAEQNNFCGLGAVNNAPKGYGGWFNTPQLGARAQIQHLFAYAEKGNISKVCDEEIIDPRFHLVNRGSAEKWTGLNGKWAVPGTTYGQSILDLYYEMKEYAEAKGLLETKEKEKEEKAEEPKPVENKPSGWAEEAIAWCIEKGISDGTFPKETCTREQVMTMLYRLAHFEDK